MEDGQGTSPPAGRRGQRTNDAPGTQPIAASFTRHAVEQAGIAPGSEVVSSDLETVGMVRRLLFDTDRGTLAGIVVHRGSRFTGDRELPCAAIARLDDGAVYLSIPMADLLVPGMLR